MTFKLFLSLIILGISTVSEASLHIRKCCLETQELDAFGVCVDRILDSGNVTTGEQATVSSDLDFPWWLDGEVVDTNLFQGHNDSKDIEFGVRQACDFHVSAVLYSTSAFLSQNGSLVHNNITIPPDMYCADRFNSTQPLFVYILDIACLTKCCSLHAEKQASLQCISHIGNVTWKTDLGGNFTDSGDNKTALECSEQSVDTKSFTGSGVWVSVNEYNMDALKDLPAHYCGQRTAEAVLMCEKPPEVDLYSFVYLLPISSFILVMALLVVLMIPEARSIKSNVLTCNVVSVLVTYVVRMTVRLREDRLSQDECYFYFFVDLFFFLAGAFWINALCFDIARTFSRLTRLERRSKEQNRRTFMWYSLYSWGCPAIMVLVTLVMEFTEDIPDTYIKPNVDARVLCGFAGYEAGWAYAGGQALCLSAINSLLLCYAIVAIARAQCFTAHLHTNRRDGSKCLRGWKRFILYVNLLCLVGPTRMIATVIWAVKGPSIVQRYLDEWTSILRSISIFLFIICKPRVLRRIPFIRRLPFLSRRSLSRSQHTSTTGRRSTSTTGRRSTSSRRVESRM